MNAGRVAVGHPVDVASGAVFTAARDFAFPGGVPLDWRRYYSTASTADSWLGRGWFVPVFMSLERTADAYRLTGEQGDRLDFPTPQPLAVGQSAVRLDANMDLRREADRMAVLHWHHAHLDVEWFVFPTAPGAGAVGPLDWIENLAGHRITVARDPSGRPVRLTQELEGREFDLTYDRDGLLAEVTWSADGSRRSLVRYVYDRNRQLIAASDAVGATTVYRYDPAGRMVEETNPLGSTFRFEYDSRGRCVRAAGDDGFVERRLSYHTAPARTRVTDGRGNVTTYLLNPTGQVVQEMDARGTTTTSEFDEYGRPTKLTAPDGGVERYEYDAAGNRTGVTDACGGRIAVQYTALHRPAEVTDATGAVWGFEYDAGGNLTATTNPAGRRWEYVRDARGLIAEVRTPGGRVVRLSHGPDLRWQEASDQLGPLHRVVYDAAGNPTELHDAGGLIQRMRYDERNRLTEVTAADGSTVRFRHNPLGQTTEQVGPTGDSTRWVYDRFGQLVAHTTGVGTLRLEYDREQAVTAVVNRVGERHEFTRDGQGRVTAERFFDGRTVGYEYDLAGRRVGVRLADGRRVEQTFDKCSRLTARRAAGGFEETFAYSPTGDVVRAGGNGAEVAFERDALGRVVAEEQNGLRVEYEYDDENRRVARRIPAAPAADLRLGYDLRGRLVRLADAAGVCQEWEYDPLGRPARRTFPGPGVETHSPQVKLHSLGFVSSWRVDGHLARGRRGRSPRSRVRVRRRSCRNRCGERRTIASSTAARRM